MTIDKGNLMLYVFEKGRVSVPMLMLDLSLSYPTARKVLSELEERRAVQREEGMSYVLDADLLAQGAEVLRPDDENVRELMQANEEEYKAMRAAYVRGRANLGEFTRTELRRLQRSIGDDVWSWLVAHGVVTDSYEFVMDKKVLGSILALLRAFCYGDEE
ncbi:MAG: hypothetical protein IJT69_01060 [Clostridia bacterium]|nr:hypothetical protein [Clostridia bacterium]